MSGVCCHFRRVLHAWVPASSVTAGGRDPQVGNPDAGHTWDLHGKGCAGSQQTESILDQAHTPCLPTAHVGRGVEEARGVRQSVQCVCVLALSGCRLSAKSAAKWC